MDLHKIK